MSYGRFFTKWNDRKFYKMAIAIAVGGGAVQLFGYFVRNRQYNIIAYTDHFRKAVAVAKANAGMEYLLGKPLEIKVSDKIRCRESKQYFSDSITFMFLYFTQQDCRITKSLKNSALSRKEPRTQSYLST